ncbi:hypothetical protein Pyn_31206 [Prunus yedoensis var. nudiflora]|uniref:Uncharacterized protein n=1 Tax=Prunus yedoensis var. nudiflora TaxID=2094558 RepID=A0A314U7A2_PRUYE|nr:hypothetical protein Pyn_31206 [Prunus yedoensis var. nudiflora]
MSFGGLGNLGLKRLGFGRRRLVVGLGNKRWWWLWWYSCRSEILLLLGNRWIALASYFVQELGLSVRAPPPKRARARARQGLTLFM